MSRFVRYGIVVVLMGLVAEGALALSGTLLGTRQVNDAGFYDAGNKLVSTTFSNGYADCISGGRLHVYFKNNEASAVTITNVVIDGVAFEDTPEIWLQKHETKWYMAWPRTVQPGECAAIWMRLSDVTNTLGTGSIDFDVQCDGGAFGFSFDPEPSDLWFPTIAIGDNMTDIVVYMGNQGAAPITLKSWGGLEVNDRPVTGSLPTTTVSPGAIVPVSYTLPSALGLGSQVVFKVTANDDSTTAIGHLRAFPSRFDVTMWSQGLNWDTNDAVLHNLNLNVPGQDYVVDEPGGRVPTGLIAQVYSLWTNAEQGATEPLMSQQTAYPEGLIYNGIWDVNNSHHDGDEFDLAVYNAWPYPAWYVPFNAWARSERANTDDGSWPERWPSLEGVFYTSARAIGWGAKQLQWFMYMNLWDQVYEGRDQGVDYGRVMQDIYQVGVVNNPILWKRVARANAVAQTVRSFLVASAPIAHAENDDLMEIGTVLSGTNRVVVTISDRSIPPTAPSYLDGYEKYDARSRYNYTFEVDVPTFAQTSAAFLIDPFYGVTNIAISAVDGDTVRLTIPELTGGAVMLLGDGSDGATLRSAWAETTRYDVDDVVASASLRSVEEGANWRFTNMAYRQVVVVTNNSGGSRSLLGLPLDLPEYRAISSNAVRVVEINGTVTNEVSFFIEPTTPFLDLSSGACKSYYTYDGPNSTSTWSAGELTFKGPTNSMGRSNPQLNVRTSPGGGYKWIEDQSSILLEVQNEDFDHGKFQQWRMRFDTDKDGTEDVGYTLYEGQVYLDGHAGSMERLEDGWRRYIVNGQDFWAYYHTNETYTGQWRLQLLDAFSISTVDKLDCEWKLRRMDLTGGRVCRVQPYGGSIGNGQTRTYHVYYDLPENGARPPSAYFNASLSGAYAEDVSYTLLGTEAAGAQVTSSVGSPNVTFVTAGYVTNALVRHVDSAGAILSETFVTPATPRAFSLTLTRNMAAGDRLIVVPIQASGQGVPMVYAADGSAYEEASVEAQHTSTAWTRETTDLRPYSLDMTDDGNNVAVTYEETLKVYDGSGGERWSSNLVQRFGFAEFTDDGQYLYFAANLSETSGETGISDDSDWHIVKVNASTGAEQWRHRVGGGLLDASVVGRTVFDLEVFPDGGVAYGEWNGLFVKLNAAGSVQWTNQADGMYANGIKAIDGTNAVVLSDTCRKLNGAGEPDGAPLTLETSIPVAIGAAKNADVWAYAGNSLFIVSNNAKVASVYLGRTPRTIAVSDDGAFIAVGTMDGTVALVRNDGEVLWQDKHEAAIVGEVAFLPGGQGVVAAREVFDYAQTREPRWLMHDEVTAYNLSGNVYWRDVGPTHTHSFCAQVDVSTNGSKVAVYSGNEARMVEVSVPVDYPTLSPHGGPVYGAVTVALASASGSIYYTLDGSTPTNTSTLYSGPFVVTTDTLVRAVSVVVGNYSIETSAQFYEAAAAPTLSPTGGAFAVSQPVAMATVTPDATIRYTLDGSEPSAASSAYASPITLTKDTTVKAATFKGDLVSETTTGLFTTTNRTATPVVSPSGGYYNYQVTVTITCATPDAVIYYTDDESTPTTNDTLYEGPFVVQTPTTAAYIRARAFTDTLNQSGVGWQNYAIDAQVDTPTIDPAGGAFTGSVTVTLSTVPGDASLYYTTDGTTPSTGSTPYGAPFDLTGSATVKVIGVRAGLTDSDVATATFNACDTVAPSTPTGPVCADLFGTSLKIEWVASTDNVAVAGYTVLRDGQAVGTNAAGALAFHDVGLAVTSAYTYGVAAFDANGNHSSTTELEVVTLYNMALNPGFEWDADGNSWPDYWGQRTEAFWSSEAHAGAGAYGVSADPAAQDTYVGQTVLLDSDRSYTLAFWSMTTNVDWNGVLLRYVELGEDTHIRSTSWRKGTQDWARVEATFTTQTNLTNGRLDLLWAVSNGVFHVDDIYLGLTEGDMTATPTPVIAPAAGVYGASVMVTVTCSDAFADIYYTTDGDDPTTNDTRYSGPFAVGASATVKAMAVRMGLDNSAVASAVFTLDTSAPTAPPGFHAAMTNGMSVYLDWSASTDDHGMGGYRLYRDGALLLDTAGTEAKDTNTAVGTAYTYGVCAYDGVGNVSATSTLQVTTSYNMLRNPSFEEGSPWPTSWGRQRACASNVTSVAYLGQTSLIITNNGLDYWYSDQRVYPTGGVEYTLSARIKTESVEGGEVYVRWVRLNGSGNSVENLTAIGGTVDWTNVVKTFTLNADVSEGRIDLVWDHTNGTAWIDDVWFGTTNGTASSDTDLDGIDDDWEIANFGNLTTVNATSDYDGDGFLDINEYLAGTQPTNTGSALTAQGDDSGMSGDAFIVKWSSVSGKSYTLQVCTNLGNGFSTVQSGISATPPQNVSTVNVPSIQRRYYRIKLDN